MVSLVTLGTPNQGSELADDYNWAGYFIGATAAMRDLRPSFVRNTFNKRYPAKGALLANGGRIYTIRGDCDGWDCWGWGGELALGWETLRWIHWGDNDGLVPNNAVKITGAIHLADFRSYDHMDLVRKSSVAKKAASVLK